MLMRRWTPQSQVPTTSMDHNTTSQPQRAFLRWCKVIISGLIFTALLSFCIVYTLQKETFFNEDYRHKQEDQHNQQQQLSFDTYIQDISKILLEILDLNHIEEKFLLHIRTKTLIILRQLDTKRKKDVILFLYERNLIQNNQLNLRGADLNNVELICPRDLNRLHLPEILWANGIFINCRLTYAILDHAYLINARFINSTLQYASLIEANLDNSHFIQTIVMNTNFNGASLIQANFLQADFVQANNFTNADLYQAKLTNDQWEGKAISILKHDFHHARFPNGSFGLLNSEANLVLNGDAEIECWANKQTIWTAVSDNMALSTDTIENITTNFNHWGNCSFIILAKSRVYQNINLHSYSLLIDTNNGAFSFLAFANCNQSYFEIEMYRSDNILHKSKIYSRPMEEIESYDNKSMHLYGEYEYHLPKRTRNVTIYFGVETLKDDIQCYFDNITFTIHQNKLN